MSMCLLECYSNYNFIKTTVLNNFNVHNLIMQGVTLIRKHSIYFFRVVKLFYICHFTCASQEPSMTDRWRNIIRFFFLIKKKFFFLLYNIVLVLPYINMNPPQVYTWSPSWTPLPPPSLYHPSGSSQCTSPKHPVSCIEPGLVIPFIYDIIHVSMPFSQIIPPSPSPTESKRLFYTSVSLLLTCIQGYRYHLSKFHIYALVYCIGVFLSGLLHSV